MEGKSQNERENKHTWTCAADIAAAWHGAEITLYRSMAPRLSGAHHKSHLSKGLVLIAHSPYY